MRIVLGFWKELGLHILCLSPVLVCAAGVIGASCVLTPVVFP